MNCYASVTAVLCFSFTGEGIFRLRASVTSTSSLGWEGLMMNCCSGI